VLISGNVRRPEQNFVLARIVSPQFPPDWRVQSQSCDRNFTPIVIGANFSFFPEAMQFFPKPDNFTPIAIGPLSLKLRSHLAQLAIFHFLSVTQFIM
jgi:hypothetical protein